MDDDRTGTISLANLRKFLELNEENQYFDWICQATLWRRRKAMHSIPSHSSVSRRIAKGNAATRVSLRSWSLWFERGIYWIEGFCSGSQNCVWVASTCRGGR
jgi:hypothetical protein